MGIPVVFVLIMRVPFFNMMVIQVVHKHVISIVVWSIQVIVMFTAWVRIKVLVHVILRRHVPKCTLVSVNNS